MTGEGVADGAAVIGETDAVIGEDVLMDAASGKVDHFAGVALDIEELFAVLSP